MVKTVLIDGCLFLTDDHLCFYASLPIEEVRGILCQSEAQRFDLILGSYSEGGILVGAGPFAAILQILGCSD
jgi:hypothetical protein